MLTTAPTAGVGEAHMPPRHANLHGDVFTKCALGGVSNIIASGITNPVDVVKVRMQLQTLAPPSSTPAGFTRYNGFSHGLRTVWKEEGIVGLSKGFQAMICRESTYGALRFGLYDISKDFYEETVFPSASHAAVTPLYIKFLAGATSGGIGSALANPMDLIKIRMQGDRTGARYQNSFWIACRDTYQHDGFIKGFYRGLGATMLRAMVVTATQLPCYDQTKTMLLNAESLNFQEGFTVHFIASMVAGLMTATTSSPVDVLKTKIVNECSKTAVNADDFRNSSQVMRRTFMKVLHTDGVRGFFKGWFPNWLRIGPHTVITLMVYGELRAMMGLNPI